jgi:hypothetical protein
MALTTLLAWAAPTLSVASSVSPLRSAATRSASCRASTLTGGAVSKPAGASWCSVSTHLGLDLEMACEYSFSQWVSVFSVEDSLSMCVRRSRLVVSG